MLDWYGLGTGGLHWSHGHFGICWVESGVKAVGLVFAVAEGSLGFAAALLEWALVLELAQASAVALQR